MFGRSKPDPSQAKEKEQIQLQLQIKGLDDVFHNVIIALERLERFLDFQAGSKHPAKVTAIGTERDLHDDSARPPGLALLHGELATQCLALFYQTKLDKQDLRSCSVLRHFVGDLLTWYGGRDSRRPADDVEKYALPILAALDRFVDSPLKISAIIEAYIIKLDNLSDSGDEEKEEAVREGFTAWLKGSNVVGERMKAFQEALRPDDEVPLTGHVRGTAEDGLRRLVTSYMQAYEDRRPVNALLRSVLALLPELTTVKTELLGDADLGDPTPRKG
jgi:hypothetical protein